MSTIFFISDTHFQHKNIIAHEPKRNFKSIEEHDEYLVERWNSVVSPKDVVWHLGDVGLFHKSSLEPIRACNGRKKLILGNHDIFGIDTYLEYFAEVYPFKDKYGFFLSHIPIHPSSVGRWNKNIHGHIHSKQVKTLIRTPDQEIRKVPDDRYINVSVESIDFTPISLEEIRECA